MTQILIESAFISTIKKGCDMLEHGPKRSLQLALLGAAHSFNHSLFVIAPTLLVLITNEFKVTNFVIGSIVGTASFIYGFGALAGGPLGDRLGEIKTIVLSVSLSGASAFIMLLAGFAKEISFFTFALILMAVWGSLYHPTANSLISKAFKGKVAESMGIHGVGGTLGLMAAPIIAGVVGVTFGWPWAFTIFGVACVFVAILLARSFHKNNGDRPSRGSLLAALRIREIWALLIFNVAIGLFMKGVDLYYPKYLNANRGFSVEGAALVYTLLLGAGVAGQWIGGRAADRVGSKKVIIFTSTGIVFSFLALLFMPIQILGVAIFTLVYGLTFYAHQPALNALTGFCCPQDQRGMVYGLFFFTNFGIGSISQFAAGYIADAYGFDPAFYMITVFAVVSLLLAFGLPEKREPKY